MSASTKSLEVHVFLEVKSRVCDLSGRHPFKLSICVKNSGPHTITLRTAGSFLDPTAAFSEGHIAIIDVESGELVIRLASVEDDIAAVSSNLLTGKSSYITLSAAFHSESLYQINFSTRPGVSSNGSYLVPNNTTGLKANHQHTPRFTDFRVTWWRYGTQPEISTQEATSKLSKPYKPADLDSISEQSSEFRMITALFKPSEVSMSLSTSSNVCHISGKPAFTSTISFTSHVSKSITVLAVFSLSFNQICVEIIDAETEENVALDNLIHACPDSFIILELNISYLQQMILSPVANPAEVKT